MTIRIVTDSTADLDAADIEQYDITVVPLTINFGSESYRAGVDIQTDEFYERLRLQRDATAHVAAITGCFSEGV